GIEGELDVDTGSGDVVVRNARVGTLGVDTGSGAVTLEAFRADALNVDTGSGGVRGGGDAESVSVDTGSGNVSLDLGPRLRDALEGTIGDGRGRLEVDTGSGSITVRRK